MKDRGKLDEHVDGAPHADSKPGVADNRTRPQGGGGRLIVAVTVAMLLGVASGLWLSAQLASAAMEAQNPSQPTLNAERSESATMNSAPDEPEDVSAVANMPSPPTAAGESDDEKESISAPHPAPAENAEGARGESNAARPSAAESETPRETVGRKNAPARIAASPCPLYASASALTIRNGTDAALVLGGPGRHGRVSVTTPDWADIAVFSEGAAGGNRGWMRYSVRSVSKRAGVFSVRVNSVCGSLNIPVRVVRP